MYNEETGMYEGYIYQIYNPFNMKSYIGQTIQTVHKRMIAHKTSSKRKASSSIYLYTDVRNYGWDIFNVYTLLTVESNTKEELREKLNDLEIQYIKRYNSQYPNCYNISKGGDVLPNTFPECRVYQFNLDKVLIAEYDSISDAARINNLSQSDISNCCNGIKVVTVGGYYWSKTPVLNLSGSVHRQKTRIDLYDSNHCFLKTFNSVSEAALEIYGSKTKNYIINNYLRRPHNSPNSFGHIWKYHDEE